LGGEDVDGSLEVVCDGGEVDLDGGFREAAPSHSAQAVAAFPVPKIVHAARIIAEDGRA